MIYAVKNWDKQFENNRSRRVENLQWVCVPNKHDGEGYCLIMEQENSAELFAAWVLILQVASKCHLRGTLVREDGTPMTPKSLAIKTRAPEAWFEAALTFFTTNVLWMECHPSDTQVSPACHSSDTQVTKKEGKEEKGMERREGGQNVTSEKLLMQSERAIAETPAARIAQRIADLVPSWSSHLNHIEMTDLSDNLAKWLDLEESDWKVLQRWFADSTDRSKYRVRNKSKLIQSPDEELAKAIEAGFGTASAAATRRLPENWRDIASEVMEQDCSHFSDWSDVPQEYRVELSRALKEAREVSA